MTEQATHRRHEEQRHEDHHKESAMQEDNRQDAQNVRRLERRSCRNFTEYYNSLFHAVEKQILKFKIHFLMEA